MPPPGRRSGCLPWARAASVAHGGATVAHPRACLPGGWARRGGRALVDWSDRRSVWRGPRPATSSRTLVDPPQVPLRISHPRHPLAEGKIGWPGDRSRAGRQSAVERASGVRDIDPQVRRGRRPVGLRVEQHDQSVADFHDVADSAVRSKHPGSWRFLVLEHRRQERDLGVGVGVGVGADHPRVHSRVTGGNVDWFIVIGHVHDARTIHRQSDDDGHIWVPALDAPCGPIEER